MNLGMQLGTNVKLEQALTAQMLQSVQILQMTTQDLELAVKQELNENPLLEMDENEAEEMSTEDTPEEEKYLESDESDDAEAGMLNDNSKEIDWEEFFNEGFANAESPLKDLNVPDYEEEEWKNQTKDTISVQDKLYAQVRDWKRPQEILDIVFYLIDSLDEQGYLKSAQKRDTTLPAKKNSNVFIQEAEAVIDGNLDLKEATEQVQEAFHILHSLEPKGIGARNLQECLLIQAYAIPNFSPLAIQILENHFDDLKALKYAQIAKDLNVEQSEVLNAVQALSVLSPHPGILINDAPVSFIAPDLEVIEEKSGCFKAVLKKESKFLSRLKINQTYKRLLLDKRTSKKDKEFIREKLNKANMFIHCVGNRETTMERVMQKIIEFQPEFFLKGKGFLRPMLLSEVADALNLNLSTISRVVNGKYVETKYGVFELKQFFSVAVKQQDGKDLSAKNIIDTLKEIIDNEDKKHPFSDQALVEELAKKGIKIARRTVTKYREENLKILSTRHRKVL